MTDDAHPDNDKSVMFTLSETDGCALLDEMRDLAVWCKAQGGFTGSYEQYDKVLKSVDLFCEVLGKSLAPKPNPASPIPWARTA